ncbi:MAG: GNAT family N-acetyltransferase [Acidiferrobacterales bacterium]
MTQLEVTISYLEMKASPAFTPHEAPGEQVDVVRVLTPTVSFYRYLYNTVGEPWLWYERRRMNDETLRAIVQNPKVELFVLYVASVPAGYAELDRRVQNEVELAYFGLIPEFIGRGLGTYLLNRALEEAWRGSPRRIWVHTCTLDHPQAIQVYQRAGFVLYKNETVLIDDPRLDGTI